MLQLVKLQFNVVSMRHLTSVTMYRKFLLHVIGFHCTTSIVSCACNIYCFFCKGNLISAVIIYHHVFLEEVKSAALFRVI